jgi:hypothetical protein
VACDAFLASVVLSKTHYPATPYVSQSEFGCILGQPILEITLAQRGFFSLHVEGTYVTEFPPATGQGIDNPYLSIF